MKHLLNLAKRNKSRKPARQSISSGGPAGIAAGSYVESDGIPDDEGGGTGPQITFQNEMDMDRALPASEARTPGFAIGETDYGNRPATEDSSYIGEAERTEASGVAMRAHRGALLGGAQDDTEKFGPLKVVLGAIHALYANHEETFAVNNRIENLLYRLVTLEERLNSRPSDVADQRYRDELIRKLDIIEQRLRFFSENPRSPLLTDRIQDGEDVFQPLEDLREAMLDYQMTQQTTNGDQGIRHIDSGSNIFSLRVSGNCGLKEDPATAEAVILNNVRCAQQAEYRHDNRGGCLRGTRTVILDEIELWIRDPYKPPVYWLNGLAGTGKSTIAQTIAERAFADGRLGASFFCSRDFEDRRNIQSIFPTLAVQLARKYTGFRSTFTQLVQSDPEIVHESLYNQLKKLIVQPLANSNIRTVIVIDALDECKDEEPASAILSVLGQFVADLPTVKFFITGRPETRIQEGFRLPLLAKATDVFVLHEVKPSLVNNDIRLFFRHSLSELKRHRRGLDGWPTEEQIVLLCERSGGLFAHAMATVRFIGERNSSPKKQLDRLLQSQGSSVFEGRTKFKTNATLDSLYTSILQEAFGDDNPENDPRVRSVLGAMVLATNPLSPSAIATLLGFESEEVIPLLSSIRSFLILQDDIDQPVRPFHKTFPDFIVDPTRCADPRFRVYPPDQHAELLFGCLETMNRGLKRNLCKLPDGVINSEVIDLRERANEHIGQALEYACRSWYKHLVGAIPARITPILRQFLEEKFLFWLEALSVLGAAKEAVHALEAIEKCEWVENQASSTLDLVRDYSHFIITFFEIINLSAPHIYHSALPLSPQTSIIRELHKQYTCPLPRVVRGLPPSWDPTVTTDSRVSSHTAIWSPCNSVIAIVGLEFIVTLDAATLSRLDTFAIPSRYLGNGHWRPRFSPDGCRLTLIGKGELISWDLQTGGPLGAIPSGLEREADSYLTALSSTYSEDGKVVAVAYSAWSLSIINWDTVNEPNTFIRTYDLSGTEAGPCCTPKGEIIEPIWTHERFIRFVTINPGSVAVSEVEFTLTNPPVEVESFPIADKIVGGTRFLFLPSLSRLAFTVDDTIQVWDAKAAKLLLRSELRSHALSFDHPIGSFSSDGRFFAHVDKSGVARVWKESPAGYVLHQKLPFVTNNFNSGVEPRLSPSGESIIMSPDRGAFHLWHTRDQVPSLPSISTNDFTLVFSPNERFAAFTRRRENVVTVFNPLTGDLRLTVNTNMGVVCLGMTGSALIVVGQEKIVTWDLPGDCAFNASTNDSVQTTILHRSQGEFTHMSISPDFSRIAVLAEPNYRTHLQIYDMSTGSCLASTEATQSRWVGFTRDGREVWTASYHLDVDKGWNIVEDSGSGPIKLEPRYGIMYPSGVFPWKSRHGYEVTRDGWVLSATQKRLLWLPHRWRSDLDCRTWSGRFLGLLQSDLSDIVILEFP